MLHRNVLSLAVIAVYYAISAWGLYIFDAELLTASAVLFGIPAIVLARFTVAPPMVILSVTMLGTGVAFMLESVAHMYGLWYSLGITETRVFGLVPIEMLIAIVFQVVFLGLLYEVFFDDGVYTPRSAWQRFSFFVAFAVSVVVLIGVHRFITNDFFLNYSYMWIVGTLIASSLAVLAIHKEFTVGFFDRAIDYVLIAAMPLGIFLYLAVENVHRVFAHPDAYIAMLPFFGVDVPLEEIILLFALPFFVATIYEIYLDDRA